MNAFLRGEYTMDEEFQELVSKGKKTQAEADSMIQLANEVQYSILTKKLVPGACLVVLGFCEGGKTDLQGIQ